MNKTFFILREFNIRQLVIMFSFPETVRTMTGVGNLREKFAIKIINDFLNIKSSQNSGLLPIVLCM